MNLNRAIQLRTVASTPPVPAAAQNNAPATTAGSFPAAGPSLAHHALGARRGTSLLTTVPPETRRQIVSYLAPRDQIAAGITSRITSTNNPNFSAPDIVRIAQASTVQDLQTFMQVLDRAGTAAARAQATPNGANAHDVNGLPTTLSALAGRVDALPLREQIGAYSGLERATRNYPRLGESINLPELRNEVSRRLTDDSHNLADSGVNVAHMARFLGVTELGTISDWEDRAISFSSNPESAWARANASHNINQIVEQFGIRSELGRERLEGVLLQSSNENSASGMVRRGASSREIAEAYGITTDVGLGSLDMHVIQQATREVLNGADVEQIIASRDISEPQDQDQLAMTAQTPEAILASEARLKRLVAEAQLELLRGGGDAARPRDGGGDDGGDRSKRARR